ncbi:MAG TPA: histidine kinase dimerization/phospho-acceptor domain-containing protein [Pyrinomonadaceae bacterium]|jgi:signal transduction histidine kinase
MKELTVESVPATTESKPAGARLRELNSLGEEIVELFYTQTFSPGSISTPADVCDAFSSIILRHWDLCCIAIYLLGPEGHLVESAVHTSESYEQASGREVSARLAASLETEGGELQAWLDESDAGTSRTNSQLRRMLEEAGLRAGVAVPIHVRGKLVGALIAVTVYPERLREALSGIRFIAAPVVIGVGNARRANELREQHQRIEQLVEELRQHSSALEDANRELRHVAHYRSLFLGRMSHELRTPLTSILGFAEILLEHENLTESQRRFCGKIQSSGLQLQTSLNQLVDLSRLEAGQCELFLHEFSLREALRESCAAVARLARKEEVNIDCATGPQLPSIVSDEGKLRQVLYNFFANAISRSPAGETVSIQVENQTPSRFQIIIEDHGEVIGDMSRIFEPVDITAPSENAACMNELGLVISRRLIDVLGGSVTLESLSPHGLKVTIELPSRPTNEERSK